MLLSCRSRKPGCTVLCHTARNLLSNLTFLLAAASGRPSDEPCSRPATPTISIGSPADPTCVLSRKGASWGRISTCVCYNHGISLSRLSGRSWFGGRSTAGRADSLLIRGRRTRDCASSIASVCCPLRRRLVSPPCPPLPLYLLRQLNPVVPDQTRNAQAAAAPQGLVCHRACSKARRILHHS